MNEGEAINMANIGIESLWPEDFGVSEITVPVVILRQQAYFLGQKTRNILEGEVSSHPFWPNKTGAAVFTQSVDEPNNALLHSFYIKALALGGYRYKLFSVTHKAIPIYPLNISFEGKTSEIDDEEEFCKALRNIFGSEATKKVIQALISQSLSEVNN